jgi:hypothetical protein|tara:strand:+ start:152 stop:445 length:294 start_codon:yes stop_codon:yes gene_type:complete
MAHIYWTGPKASEKEVKDALMKEIPDYTDSAFYVKKQSDDTSTHMSIYVEKEDTSRNFDFKWKQEPPHKFMGWRILIIFCPIGYVSGVLQAPKTEWE